MSGKKSYYKYEADDGIAYSFKLDDSNSVVTGFIADNGASAVPPQGLRMRYVLGHNKADPTQRRRFWVGTPEYLAMLIGTGILTTVECNQQTVNWQLTYYGGEKGRISNSGSDGGSELAPPSGIGIGQSHMGTGGG